MDSKLKKLLMKYFQILRIKQLIVAISSLFITEIFFVILFISKKWGTFNLLIFVLDKVQKINYIKLNYFMILFDPACIQGVLNGHCLFSQQYPNKNDNRTLVSYCRKP